MVWTRFVKDGHASTKCTSVQYEEYIGEYGLEDKNRYTPEGDEGAMFTPQNEKPGNQRDQPFEMDI